MTQSMAIDEHPSERKMASIVIAAIATRASTVLVVVVMHGSGSSEACQCMIGGWRSNSRRDQMAGGFSQLRNSSKDLQEIVLGAINDSKAT